MTRFKNPFLRHLRDAARALPGVSEGESCVNRAFKVGSKNFLFLGESENGHKVMLKLGPSLADARARVKRQPAVYAVGKTRWVTITFVGRAPARRVVERWIEESYRELAAKKWIAELDGEAKTPTKKTATKKTATKKTATKITATKITVKEFVAALPPEIAPAFKKLRSALRKNLPKGFKEEMNGGMVGYVVPLSRYPDGYHTSRGAPLPFINITGRKSGLVVYHMGLYADPKLAKWFTSEWKKRCDKKLDMGKSCIRLKHLDHVPYDLLGELAQKVSVDEWIAKYESDRE